jgi:hypothetical protein
MSDSFKKIAPNLLAQKNITFTYMIFCPVGKGYFYGSIFYLSDLSKAPNGRHFIGKPLKLQKQTMVIFCMQTMLMY